MSPNKFNVVLKNILLSSDGLKDYHDARFASENTLLMTDVTSGDDGPASVI